MASDYCLGCTCDSKTISGPSFSACRTRHLGGIAGIVVACRSDLSVIDETAVDFSDEANVSTQLFTFLDGIIDNNADITFVDDANAGANVFHYWCVDADMPETEDEVEEATNCSSKSVITRTQKIVGDIIDVNNTNYSMMQTYQCLNDMRIWFVTTSGQFYGGAKGINVSLTKFNYIIPRGLKEVQKMSFEFEWECQAQPPRVDVDWSLPNPGFIS